MIDRAGQFQKTLTVDTRTTMTDPDARKVITFHDAYESDSFTCGDAGELADDLIAAAPDASFTVSRSRPTTGSARPACMCADLGLFTADCNNYGNPMFPWTWCWR